MVRVQAAIRSSRALSARLQVSAAVGGLPGDAAGAGFTGGVCPFAPAANNNPQASTAIDAAVEMRNIGPPKHGPDAFFVVSPLATLVMRRQTGLRARPQGPRNRGASTQPAEARPAIGI